MNTVEGQTLRRTRLDSTRHDSFQFVDLPDAAGDVSVWIAYRGDFGASGEFAMILGEGGAGIGTAGATVGVDCGATPQEKDFVVAQDRFNGWNEDLTVDLAVDLCGPVAPVSCGDLVGIAAEVSLTLLYDAPGGCP